MLPAALPNGPRVPLDAGRSRRAARCTAFGGSQRLRLPDGAADRRHRHGPVGCLAFPCASGQAASGCWVARQCFSSCYLRGPPLTPLRVGPVRRPVSACALARSCMQCVRAGPPSRQFRCAPTPARAAQATWAHSSWSSSSEPVRESKRRAPELAGRRDGHRPMVSLSTACLAAQRTGSAQLRLTSTCCAAKPGAAVREHRACGQSRRTCCLP